MVLIVSYSGAWGGAERLLIDWAPGLADDLCLACPPGKLAKAAQRAELRVFPIPSRSLVLRGGAGPASRAAANLAAHAREIHRLTESLDPDLLVVWGMRSAIAACAGRRVRCPVLFHHNDFLPAGPAGALVRRAARRADLVTASSHALAGDLDPGRRLGDRLVVVHPGVDAARPAARRRPADPPEVLVLGSIVPWKRPDLALEACALARRGHPELRLRLVGEPLDSAGHDLLAALRRRAQKPDLAGAVEFAGPVAQPELELARATCLLHCAEREPFGLAVLEALAAGVPAVVPAAAGPQEIVDPSSGILYPPGDAQAAAAALGSLLSDSALRARLSAGALALVSENFDLASSRARWAAAAGSVRRSAPAGDPPGAAATSVVTVTHNSSSAIGPLLRSVKRHLPGGEVIVVDCASADDTVERVAAFPTVRLIPLEKNIGFGRASNLGLAEVAGPVCARLNPDVELLDDSLANLARAVNRPGGPDRLLAPVLVGPDGRREDSVHPLPATPAELLAAVLPGTLLPRALAVAVAPWRAVRARRVGWAVGAALVGRTETLRRLGPFSEEIFMYGEDLDLGLRAAAAGVEIWFCPDARLLHQRAHATREAYGGEPYSVLARARRIAVERNLGGAAALLDDVAQGITFSVRILAKGIVGRGAGRERRQLQALLQTRLAAVSAEGDRRE